RRGDTPGEMKNLGALLLVVVPAASLAMAPAALADVPPPDTQSCSNKQTGDACNTDDGRAGKCTDATCTKLDYSDGSPPTSVSYACKKCVAGGDNSCASSTNPNVS